MSEQHSRFPPPTMRHTRSGGAPLSFAEERAALRRSNHLSKPSINLDLDEEGDDYTHHVGFTMPPTFQTPHSVPVPPPPHAAVPPPPPPSRFGASDFTLNPIPRPRAVSVSSSGRPSGGTPKLHSLPEDVSDDFTGATSSLPIIPLHDEDAPRTHSEVADYYGYADVRGSGEREEEIQQSNLARNESVGKRLKPRGSHSKGRFHRIGATFSVPSTSFDNHALNGKISHSEVTPTSSAHIPPPPLSLSGRSVSTAERLQRQGLRSPPSAAKKHNSPTTFAVRSIHRGSEQWAALVKPFVSDLAFRSVIRRRYQSEVSFRPYTCHAAVLFLDLSGYSRITAAISHKGAHFLSSVVNAYLERLLKIIYAHGGDVVKFAGDAVLVVWEGSEAEKALNLLCAANCVLEMLCAEGEFLVEGTDLSFRFHAGLTCGLLESEIFVAPTHVHMQRLYHSVGGETLAVIGELVDLSKAGEVCISADCLEFLGTRATYRDVPGYEDVKCLTDLFLEQAILEVIDRHIEKNYEERMFSRDKSVEEDFIHDSVLQLLSHGGLSPTQIAQMRNLCVLFIGMTSHGSSVNWLMEVQGVLDRNRCPIVQIIMDDKGVHIVAAVNLYEAIPEANAHGIQVCRELVDRQVGSVIGMAAGSTFCGVTGSSTVACRWDITGPPAVRAARLMQYAMLEEIEVAIDESVYVDPMASAQMELYNSAVQVKGSKEGCAVYTLSESKSYSAFRVRETVHGRCHDDKVWDIVNIISGSKQRCAVMVKGPPLSGKKVVCQRAAGYAELVPYLHVCDASHGLMQLARTMATWFLYAESEILVGAAKFVLDLMDSNKWSRAHDACILLVEQALVSGATACFLVDRIQFLDEFSLSLMRECLHGRKAKLFKSVTSSLSTSFSINGSVSSLLDHEGSLNDSEPSSPFSSKAILDHSPGRIAFLMVHQNLYNWASADHIVEDLTRNSKHFTVPVIEVAEAPLEELRTLHRDVCDIEMEDRWLRCYAESSGYMPGYFMERAKSMRILSEKCVKEKKPPYDVISNDLLLSIPKGCMRKNRDVQVMQISAEVAMRFAQLFDELPPVFQTFTKVLTIATRKGYFKLPRSIMWEVLNDLIAKGVEDDVMNMVLEEMQDMYLVNVTFCENGTEVIALRSPALGDVAMDVCTPVQVACYGRALIDRLEVLNESSFKVLNESSFKVLLVLADLYLQLDEGKCMCESRWRQAYKRFIIVSESWKEDEVNHWKEIIEDDIVSAGYEVSKVLDSFVSPEVSVTPIIPALAMVRLYSAPVGLGPLGLTLSVLCRNIFHEYGIFRGASKDTCSKLIDASRSAASRYMLEMTIVDSFLAAHGFETNVLHNVKEHEWIEYVSTPAASDRDVAVKAKRLLTEFVPQYVEPRLKKLHKLTKQLRNEQVPDVIKQGDLALRRAYVVLRASEGTISRHDAAEEALMIMATLNWKTKNIAEYLPIRHYQTVANLRDLVLKRLNDAERAVMIHEQSADDLEAFLLVTSLLHQD